MWLCTSQYLSPSCVVLWCRPQPKTTTPRHSQPSQHEQLIECIQAVAIEEREEHTSGLRTTGDQQVLPAEKWAVFTSKGKLTASIRSTIHERCCTASITEFVAGKHSLSEYDMDNINWEGLGTITNTLNTPKRAALSKIIHRWIPTQAMMHAQTRQQSNQCRRTGIHVSSLGGPHLEALAARTLHFNELFWLLEGCGTSPDILSTWENHLLSTVSSNRSRCYNNIHDVSTESKACLLWDARVQPNIIGWEPLLRGFMSLLWVKVQTAYKHSMARSPPRKAWASTSVRIILSLYQRQWQWRNEWVHGRNIAEAKQKFQGAALAWTCAIYQDPPSLLR